MKIVCLTRELQSALFLFLLFICSSNRQSVFTYVVIYLSCKTISLVSLVFHLDISEAFIFYYSHVLMLQILNISTICSSLPPSLFSPPCITFCLQQRQQVIRARSTIPQLSFPVFVMYLLLLLSTWDPLLNVAFPLSACTFFPCTTEKN